MPGTAEQTIVFFDADVFDLSLADLLKQPSERVRVNFAAPTSLNAIPPRINIWLSEVKHSNGQVTLVDANAPATASRGLLGVGLIFDLIDAVNTMHAREEVAQRLALAHGYDARIVYEPATGIAREIVFVRRPAPVAAAPAAPAQ